MVIGITGKSGSGKTTKAEELSKLLNIKHLKIDDVCKRAIEKVMASEKSWLDVFNIKKDYERKRFIDTKKIGDKIFNDREKYKDFISIVWQLSSEEIDEAVNQNKNIILDYILLPKTQYWEICNRKILITCPDFERKKRVLERDGITEDYFNAREKASIEYDRFKFDIILLTY